MDYPATYTVTTPAKLGNWRVLVHWLLVIPHLIINWVLSVIAIPLFLITWIVVIVSGKLPAGLAQYFKLFLRHEARMFTFLFVLTDRYPPFAFSSDDTDPGDHSARVDFETELEGRNRLTVLFRLILMIPAAIFVIVLAIIAEIVGIIMFFVLLFTGRWPAGMRRVVIGFITLNLRFQAYLYFLTDQYPIFTATSPFAAADNSPIEG